MNTPQKASIPVIKRLPKYYRYLRSLQDDGITRAATRPSGRERNQDAPQKGASIPAMRPIKSTQKGTFVWFGARGARKFKFSHFFGLLLRVRSGRPLHIYRPTRVQFNRSCTGSGEVQRRHAYDECPQKFRQTDP